MYQVIFVLREWIKDSVLRWPCPTGHSYSHHLFMEYWLALNRIDWCCKSHRQDKSWRKTVLQNIVSHPVACSQVRKLSQAYGKCDQRARHKTFWRMFYPGIYRIHDPFWTYYKTTDVRVLSTCFFSIEARFWKKIGSGYSATFFNRDVERALCWIPLTRNAVDPMEEWWEYLEECRSNMQLDLRNLYMNTTSADKFRSNLIRKISKL